MFSKKMKRVISIVLILSMIFGCNGFSVLASSVEGVVEENQIATSEKQTPNYHEYSEEKVILTSNDKDGVKNNEKGDSDNPGSVTKENLEGATPKITNAESNNGSDSFDEPSDDEGTASSEDEEPEDDVTTTVKEEVESTTETSVEESEQTTETSVEESEQTTETSVEENESTTETDIVNIS